MAWKIAGFGERLRAAKKQTGTARTTPSSVPQIAICTALDRGLHQLLA